MSATSSWRYDVDGDVLTATNRVMSYTIRLGVLYSPRSAPGRGKPIGPRRVTQFLDDGARLYTTGNHANSSHTLASVASFVSTYQVPRTLMVPTAPPAPALHDERIDRIEALVSEMHAIVRQIADGLGVSK